MINDRLAKPKEHHPPPSLPPPPLRYYNLYFPFFAGPSFPDEPTVMIHLTPKHPFLVGIDSDGCVFDTMEVKHKECFAPNVIKYFGLAGVSKYAREACDFVNLYSKSRGINRFPALIEELEWTAARPEVLARGVKITIPQSVRDWVASGAQAGESVVGEGRQGDGRPGPETSAGMVQGREPRDRGDRPQCAAVPLRPPLPGEDGCPGRRAGRLGHAARGLAAGMGRARPDPICRGHLRPGSRHEEGMPATGRALSALPYADDRRRPRRSQGGRGQRGLVLPHQSRRGRRQLEAVVGRGLAALLRRHVRRQVPGGAARRVRSLSAGTAAVEDQMTETSRNQNTNTNAE